MDKKRLILLAVVVISLAGCGGKPTQVKPSSTDDPSGSVVQSPTSVRTGVTILADGIVQSAQPPLPLAFEIGGKLLELRVQSGDQVMEGDVLARLEVAVPFDSLQAAVTSAELAVLRAQHALDAIHSNADMMTAQAQMNLAIAQDELASAEYRRQTSLALSRQAGERKVAFELSRRSRQPQRPEAGKPHQATAPNSRTRAPRLTPRHAPECAGST